MDIQNVAEETKKKLNTCIDRLQDELKKLRTGRAHAGMLDGVMVEAYGSPMPLNQVANVSAPEATLLQITPFDPNNLEAISAAIRENQSMGLNPSDDGRIVRVPIPPLTEERRREISKQVGTKLEDAMIAMRGVRHDAMKSIEDAKKNKEVSDDQAKNITDSIENEMANNKTKAEELAKTKEKEIMTV